jgi:hypothetical protein
MLRVPVLLFAVVVAGSAAAQSFANSALSASPSRWFLITNTAASPDGSDKGGLKISLTRNGTMVSGVATEEKGGARRFLVNGQLTETALLFSLHEEGVGAQCAYMMQPASATSYSGERNCAGRISRATLNFVGR